MLVMSWFITYNTGMCYMVIPFPPLPPLYLCKMCDVLYFNDNSTQYVQGTKILYLPWAPGRGHSTFFFFFQVGVCDPDFRSVGLVNWFSERGRLWTEIFKFTGLRAKIWAKIEAVEAKISKYFSKGSLVNRLLSSFAWNWTLANYGTGVKRVSSGPHIPIPLSRSVPPGPWDCKNVIKFHVFFRNCSGLQEFVDSLCHIIFYLEEGMSFMVEWQVFHFLKGQILWFPAIVIFTVFWDFTQRFFKECNVCKPESAEISRVGLSMHAQWQINYEIFVKFKEQFNKSENFNEGLLLNILKTMIFLDISFLDLQKRCFPLFSVFSVLYSISVIFPCFQYRGKLAQKFNLWTIAPGGGTQLFSR